DAAMAVDPLGARPVPPVGVYHIRAARELLAGVVTTTPVARSRALSERCGGEVWLKCENLQRTGSFKIRGAYTRLFRLDDAERAAGVVAASAGNHAQGVALAAQMLGIEATVFMPEGAAIPKVGATRGYGAQVHLVGETIEGSIAAATDFARRTGAVFVHPFDHPDIIAGQGTVGLEILEQVPDVRTVLVCTGGGGLLGGVAAAVKAQRPDVRVVGVQATGAAAWPPSMAAGGPTTLASMRTIADGIAVGRPGDITYPQVTALVDDILTVDEDALARALLLCLERAKMLVEPAGVAGVAALMEHPDRFETPVVAVLSGGNVDPLVLLHVIQHGMATAKRYLALRVRVSDRPGALAELLVQIGSHGANVLDVAHSRISGALSLGEVDVDVTLETRGPQHCAELVNALARIKSYHDYGSFTPVQVAAIVALDGPQDCVEEVRQTYQKRRDVMVRGLHDIGWMVDTPKASMYIWAKIPPFYE
ncbi:MAG: threonine ammonia-lyase, partial [Acidimicrobiales bacterium]|nr:threonine ammonia-lyase [Acidimicrobiales bacterium]